MLMELYSFFDTSLLVTSAVALLVIILWRLSRHSTSSFSNKNVPPYPVRPWPFFGHIFMLSSNPKKKFKEWREKSGDVYSLDLVGKHVVIINGFDVLKDVLVKKAVFLSRPKTYMSKLMSENNIGILNSAGANWKEQRTVTIAILRAFGMGKNVLAQKIEEEVSVYVKKLGELKGKAHDVKILTHISVSNVICSIIIGRRYEHDDPYFSHFINLLGVIMALIAGTNILNHLPVLQYLPGDLFKARRLKETSMAVGAMLNEIISKEKVRFDNDQDSASETGANFISAYLKEKKMKEDAGEPTHLDEKNLTAIIHNLFGAGSETTGNTVLFSFIHMMYHPEEQDRIYQQIVDVVGTERTPSILDKPKLNYLNAAIMETQRLASIAPFALQRYVETDLEVQGYTIPAGSIIMPNLDSVLFDEQVWGDPYVYRPSRFLDESGALRHPDEFIPFSLGRRVCLGEAMAKMELFLFISAVLQRFKIMPAGDGTLPELEGVFGITVSPKPFKIRLLERKNIGC